MEMHTVDLKTMMNQTVVEYDVNKRPVKISYQEYYNVSRQNEEPIYLQPSKYGTTHLFIYDTQGRVNRSKVTTQYIGSIGIENTTFQHTANQVVATHRREGDKEDTYTLSPLTTRMEI